MSIREDLTLFLDTLTSHDVTPQKWFQKCFINKYYHYLLL
jgi:hypothetical protein